MQNEFELRDSFYKKIKLEVKQAKIAFYESKKKTFSETITPKNGINI